MKIIEDLKYEMVMARKELYTQHRIHMAVQEKEKEYIDKIEKWLKLIEEDEGSAKMVEYKFGTVDLVFIKGIDEETGKTFPIPCEVLDRAIDPETKEHDCIKMYYVRTKNNSTFWVREDELEFEEGESERD